MLSALLDTETLLGVAAVAAAAALVRARALRRGLAVRSAVDGFFLLVAASLLFGHTADVLLYRADDLARDPSLLLPWAGGYCSLGAFAGAGLVAFAFHRHRPRGRLDWQQIDNLAVALPLAWAIARIGCALGLHHAGSRTTFALGLEYPDGRRHDLGLYDALLGFALFVLLVALDRRPRPPGWLFSVGAIAYGAARFAIEFLRGADLETIGHRSDPRYFGLTMVQYAALVLIVIGATCARGAIVTARRDRAPTAPNPAAPPG